MSRPCPAAVAVIASFLVAVQTVRAAEPATATPHTVTGRWFQSGQWTIRETKHFRICTLAAHLNLDKLPATCESLKERLESVWMAGESRHWHPCCDVIVHATLQEYQQALGNGVGNSVGCATLQYDGDRVVGRRIDIRIDADNWHTDALPHELTHVVLADRFGNHRLPPWLDEGIGVLSESAAKRQARIAAFEVARQRETIYSTSRLVNLRHFPEPEYRDAFYAQSAALVRLLIDRNGTEEFIQFVERVLNSQEDRALRDIYQISDIDHLSKIYPGSALTDLATSEGMLDFRQTLVAESDDP